MKIAIAVVTGLLVTAFAVAAGAQSVAPPPPPRSQPIAPMMAPPVGSSPPIRAPQPADIERSAAAPCAANPNSSTCREQPGRTPVDPEPIRR